MALTLRLAVRLSLALLGCLGGPFRVDPAVLGWSDTGLPLGWSDTGLPLAGCLGGAAGPAAGTAAVWEAAAVVEGAAWAFAPASPGN